MDASIAPQTSGIHLQPIGIVRASEEDRSYSLQIASAYRSGLRQLGKFSHALILWWADQMDTSQARQTLTTKLPYAPGVEAGVFACRSEYRPNPIAVTTMLLLDIDIDSGVVTLPWIDAYDGSPVLDIKPYIPISDRIRDFQVADWARDWPEWMEDAAAYFAANPIDFGE